MGFDDNTGGTMPRRSATFSVEHGFVSTRTQTDSSYTELRGGGATVPQGRTWPSFVGAVGFVGGQNGAPSHGSRLVIDAKIG